MEEAQGRGNRGREALDWKLSIHYEFFIAMQVLYHRQPLLFSKFQDSCSVSVCVVTRRVENIQ